MPGFPVLHYLPEFAQTHVHWVSDVIQPPHLLSPSSPPALNLSQQQCLFQGANSSCQVAEVLELQHQSFQRIFRVDFLSDWLVWSPYCPRDSRRVLSSSTISKASILWHSAQQLGFIKWPWEHRGKEMNSFGWDQKGFMETDIGAILPSVPWTCFVLPGMSFISSHHLPFVSNFSPSSRINKDPIWSPSLTSTLSCTNLIQSTWHRNDAAVLVPDKISLLCGRLLPFYFFMFSQIPFPSTLK